MNLGFNTADMARGHATNGGGKIIIFPSRRSHPHLHDALMFALGALAMLAFMSAI